VKFIVEGTDRAGKSTLVEVLREKMSDAIGRPAVVVHCHKDSCDWSDDAKILDVLAKADIVDRLYDSEYVYSKVIRGGASICDERMHRLRQAQEAMGATTIFVASGEDAIRERYKSSSDEYVDADKAIEIQLEYAKLFARLRPYSFQFMSGEMAEREMRARLVKLCSDGWSRECR